MIGYTTYFNNNSSELYSNTFTNYEHQVIIHIQSKYNSKIAFSTQCEIKDFNNTIQVQLSNPNGIENYSLDSYCLIGMDHYVKSLFMSGNYNLTINYTTVVGLNQNASLFTVEIREYHASIRDIRIYDNLIFPFTLLSVESLFFPFLIYFIFSDETWNQLNDIKILDRKISHNYYYTNNTNKEYRFQKNPSFLKNRRLSLVLVSYLLIY